MDKLKKRLSQIAFILWDLLAVALSTFAMYRFRYSNLDNPPYAMQHYQTQFILSTFAVIFIVNLIAGCYRSVWKHMGLGDSLRQMISSFVSFVILAVAHRWLETGYMFEFVAGVCILTFLLMILGRFSIRLVTATNARFSRSTGDKRVLIYGAGEAGRFLQNKLSSPHENMLPVVFIDDDESLIGKRLGGIKIYGGREQMKEAIKKYFVDEVIVAIPTADRETLEYVMEVCRQMKCPVRRFGNIADVDLNTAVVTNINLEELLRRDSVQLNMQTVKEFICGKVVMVTGGVGSIGSEICRQVLSFGCSKLIIYDFNENGLFYIDAELREKYAGQYCLKLGSVRDTKRLKEVFEETKPQIIFHAAAHKHVPMMEINPREAIKNNVFGTLNVANAAIMYGVEKMILISTDKAVNPTNIMGASKRIAEMTIQMLNGLSDTDFAAVRFGNVLGSNGSVVPTFQKQIERGGPVTVTHPDMRRYFMTIPEAVQLVLEAGAMANGGEIFVLDMGEPVKIYDLACDLIKLSGLQPNVDIKIEFTGLRPGEKLFEEISLKDENVTKTNNAKIFVMKPLDYDQSDLAIDIKALQSTLDSENISTMFNAVRKLVPTFKHDDAEISDINGHIENTDDKKDMEKSDVIKDRGEQADAQ